MNPGKPIPRFITGLTGISNEMVNAAPNFGAIAGTVFSFLKDCIFVAHNVNFDYSFVRKELENHGYILNTNKLCSLRMSRRIFPGYKHYSLGNICSQLGIDVSDRHRAMGDAYATVELFLRLLKNDTQNEIPKSLKKNSFDQTLPPNLPKEQFENLPKEAGVYYFRDEHQKVIYVGKAINIRKRVNSHFTGNIQTPQRQHFLREIHSITYELTGSELIALLHESSEIRRLWPKYNRAQKKAEKSFGIFSYTGQDGYERLAIDALSKSNNAPLIRYNTFAEAHENLMSLIAQHALCFTKTSIHTTAESQQTCNSDCACKKSAKLYNKRILKAKKSLDEQQQSFLIKAPGRAKTEQAYILVRKGQYCGYGFTQEPSPNIQNIFKIIQPAKHNPSAITAIQSFTEKWVNDYQIESIDIL